MFRLDSLSKPVASLSIVLPLILGVDPLWADGNGFTARFADDLRADFRQHYGWRSLGNVGVGFATTAALANTSVDKWVQDQFREDLQGGFGDDLTDVFTGVGDLAQPIPAVPIYLGAMLIGGYAGSSETAAARWAANSLRATLIGTPQLVALSHISGGQRPEEGEPGWDPFADDNGVSGHSFFGSTPILAAARMADRRWVRNTLYVVSVMPGMARIYDDKHYFSQAFMGWWLGLAASRTVQGTNTRRVSGWAVSPVVVGDGAGIAFTRRFD